jgi:hypothetical protein
MFGEKRVMDSGWADRAQQQIKDRNAWAYNKMLNAAKDSYANQSASNDAWWDENEKNPIMRAIGKADTKLMNLLSGQGTEKSFLKQHGFTPEIQEAGAAGNINAADLGNYLHNVEVNNTNEMDKGTGATAGLNNIPIVGPMLNYMVAPAAQLAGAGRDFQSGINSMNNPILSNLFNSQVAGFGANDNVGWDRWNRRDHVSDAAAAAKIGLEALTAGMGLNQLPLGKQVIGGAVTGAADNALDTVREQGNATNMGDVLKSAAFGGGMGAVFPIVGNAINNITTRGVENAVTNALQNSGFGRGMNQQQFTTAAINTLGEQQYRDLLELASKNKLANFATGSKLIGQNAFNKFKGLSKGKKALMVGGIGGGAIGLNNLLKSRNQQSQLSDEDLAALYNYYGLGE